MKNVERNFRIYSEIESKCFLICCCFDGKLILSRKKHNNQKIKYTELLEGCGASSPAQVHSMSSIVEPEINILEETLSKY